MSDTDHRYEYAYRADGDYIDLVVVRDGRWVSVTQWLIPGTELED